MVYTFLALSWWRSLSYRNQFIDLLCKSMDWFLYDRDLRHQRGVEKIFLPSFCLSRRFLKRPNSDGLTHHVSFKKKRVNWFFMQIDCLVSIRVKHQSWMSGTFSFCAYSRVYYYYHYYYCYFYYFIFKLCFCPFLGDLVLYVFHFSPFLCVIAGIICTKSLYCL